jgi:hypothetical protein
MPQKTANFSLGGICRPDRTARQNIGYPVIIMGQQIGDKALKHNEETKQVTTSS